MDGSRIRNEKVADSKISVYVWTGPKKVRFVHGFKISFRNFDVVLHILLESVWSISDSKDNESNSSLFFNSY